MSSRSQPLRHTLPEVYRHALWDKQSGLVVSLFSRALPSERVSDPKSTKYEDFTKPRLLTDKNIYLAFYPRKPIDRGELFSVLSVAHEGLSNSIMTDPSGRYILHSAVRAEWRILENSLIDVATTLYSKHKHRADFPQLAYPRWPRQHGYEDTHKTPEQVLSCARRSQRAFSMLTAFTTFALSLWLTEYEDNCFDEAFKLLAEHRVDPVPRVWLQYLKDSIVCALSPGLRPGGYLIPYNTCWGSKLARFTRAYVPFWLLWGENESLDERNLSDTGIKLYFPPHHYIVSAKTREIEYADIVLPHRMAHRFQGESRRYGPSTPSHRRHEIIARSHPISASPYNFPDVSVLPISDAARVNRHEHGQEGYFVNSNDTPSVDYNPDEPPPPVVIDRQACVGGEGQKAGESWEEFYARMMERLEHRKQQEDSKGRQCREAWEKMAESGPTKTSAVFLWEEDEVDPTFLRRTRVIKSSAYTEWKAHTQLQRFFWGHTNEWDLCPHLPPYAPGEAPAPYEDHSDDSDGFSYEIPGISSMPQEDPRPTANLGELMLESVQRLAVQHNEPEDQIFIFNNWSLSQYLSHRHGFYNSIESWNPDFHSHRHCVSHTAVETAIKNVNYTTKKEEIAPNMARSTIDFHNTVLEDGLSYANLPHAWDISPRTVAPPLLCDQRRIRLQRVTSASKTGGVVYILRPPTQSRDKSPWFVATTSATTVLLVYRSPWNTMYDIARGLLGQGIPFNTVVERHRTSKLMPLLQRLSGLGSRPQKFQPNHADFCAYEKVRNDVLRSNSGRAIYMMGGIVGRLAAEIVPEYVVLDGPHLVRELVVATHGDMEFVDDAVAEGELDIVSGVYLVENSSIENPRHISWWPKHHVFLGIAYSGDQWLPRAEQWYQQRLMDFRAGIYSLPGSTQWKQNFKMNSAQVLRILGNSERLAAEFISTDSRVV